MPIDLEPDGEQRAIADIVGELGAFLAELADGRAGAAQTVAAMRVALPLDVRVGAGGVTAASAERTATSFEPRLAGLRIGFELLQEEPA